MLTQPSPIKILGLAVFNLTLLKSYHLYIFKYRRSRCDGFGINSYTGYNGNQFKASGLFFNTIGKVSLKDWINEPFVSGCNEMSLIMVLILVFKIF